MKLRLWAAADLQEMYGSGGGSGNGSGGRSCGPTALAAAAKPPAVAPAAMIQLQPGLVALV
jgi:hypothetical protein